MACGLLSCLAAQAQPTLNTDLQAGGALLRFVPWSGRGATTRAAWRQSLRLTLTQQNARGWTWQGALQLAAQQGYGADRRLLTTAAAPLWRGDDLNPTPWQETGLLVRQNVDRLNVQRPVGPWTLTVGRQAIGHGSGRYFNPSDLLAPLSAFGLNTEYKAGVDAVKLQRPFGEENEAGLWLATHRHGWRQGAALVHLGRATARWDASLLAGVMAREPVLAWDVSGQAGGAAWYGEGVQQWGRGRKGMTRVAAGGHWFKPSGLQLVVEAQHNSAGASDTTGYARLLASSRWREGALNVGGRWHGALLLSDDYHPLRAWQVLVAHDFSGGSTLVSPGLSFDLSQTRRLRLGLQKGWGPGALTLRTPGAVAVLPRSDFGDTPLTAWAEWSWSY